LYSDFGDSLHNGINNLLTENKILSNIEQESETEICYVVLISDVLHYALKSWIWSTDLFNCFV
jgi:hypothetical protein